MSAQRPADSPSDLDITEPFDPVTCIQGCSARSATAWLSQATIGQAELPLDKHFCQHCTLCAFSPDLVAYRPAVTGT